MNICKLNSKIKSTEFLFLFIIGILFYILNYYSVSTKDDLFYRYICEDELFFKNIQDKHLVTNFSDILFSNYNHWKFINGRLLIHIIVQLFVCVLGFELFKILNTIIFVLLVKYILLMSTYNQPKLSIYIFNFFIFWFLLGLVNIGLGYMGCIAYSINYLWSSTIYIYIIYIYQKYQNKANLSSTKNWVFFVLAMIAGMTNESFSVGLSVAFFIYYIFKYKLFIGTKRYIIIGLWIGTIICCLNPSNITRFFDSNNGDYTLFLNIYNTLSHYYIYGLPFILFLGLLIYTKLKAKNISDFINDNIILILTIPSTFLFLFLIGFSGSIQMFTSIILISIILICKLLNKYYSKIFNPLFLFLMIILFSIHFSYILNYRYKQYNNYQTFIHEYIQSKDGIVKYSPLNNTPAIISNYGFYSYPTESNANPMGINMVYGNGNKEPKKIPLHIANLNKYELLDEHEYYSVYDAEWCFIIKLKGNIKCKVFVTDQYQNWITKLKNIIYQFTPIPYENEYYKVNYNDVNYLISIKTTKYIKYNNVEIIKLN